MKLLVELATHWALIFNDVLPGWMMASLLTGLLGFLSSVAAGILGLCK